MDKRHTRKYVEPNAKIPMARFANYRQVRGEIDVDFTGVPALAGSQAGPINMAAIPRFYRQDCGRSSKRLAVILFSCRTSLN